ncbi:hypothetical protein F5972_21535 [Microbispora cellulosiformans]|uniref:Uncharacterized protein n=1 Tax=Microbispora cellulosiformans TaxID=2614688 RepID=A0A5J5K1U5_9ACTN|nr:hypothetical protein [Microbispora cellulosiformans]KAA9377027.1 hypothetical protein F5972_21535 [Microbispora cellulosiformans]
MVRRLITIVVALTMLTQLGFVPGAEAATTRITLDFQLPEGFDRAEMTEWASEFNNRNDLLSDSIQEEIARSKAEMPGSEELEPRDFDGFFTVTSTGVSVTIESDVRSSDLSWWEETLLWVGVYAGGLILRASCLITILPTPLAPVAKGLCAALQIIVTKSIMGAVFLVRAGERPTGTPGAGSSR